MRAPEEKKILASLLFKEWVKLRWFAAIPVLAAATALYSYAVTLSTIMDVHGAAQTIFGFITRPSILFEGVKWALIFSGAFLALVQTLPETISGRIRLSLQLPAAHWKVFSVWAATGLILLTALLAASYGAMVAIHARLHLPPELSESMARTILPWGIASGVAWLAAASAASEPSWPRRIVIAAAGAAHVSLLGTTYGFDGMRGSLTLYFASALPWLFVFYASVLRIKGCPGPGTSLIRLGAFLAALTAFSWLLPFNAARLARPERLIADAYWSEAAGDFVITRSDAEGMRFSLSSGAALTPREGRSLLPFLFRHDLNKWGMFPMRVSGRVFTFEDAQASQVTRLSPRAVNAGMPELSAIFDSDPEGASLKLPGAVLAISKEGLKLWDIAHGAWDGAGADDLRQALGRAGAIFPLKTFASNLDPLKSFDEGAFMIDAAGQVIQAKLVNGRYYARVAETGVKDPIYLGVEEKKYSDYYGLLLTKDGVYLNLYAGGIERLAIDAIGYDPSREAFKLFTTPLSRTAVVRSFDPASTWSLKAVSLEKDTGRVIAALELPRTEKEAAARFKQDAARSAASLLALTQMSPENPRVSFSVSLARYPAVTLLTGSLLAALWLIASLVFRRRLRVTPKNLLAELRAQWPLYALITLFSFPGLLGASLSGDILAAPKKDRDETNHS